MKIRRWLVIPAIAGLAAVAALGGIAAAGGGERGETGSRVAEILELDEQTVADAFKQAMQQRFDEALQARLDKLVEAERITQAQADEIKAWYDDRPEGVPGFGFGKQSFHRGGSDIAALVAEILEVGEETVTNALKQVRDERFQTRLDQAVEDGKLTQEQAEAIAERYESGEFKERKGHHGKSWMRGGKHDADGMKAGAEPETAST